MPRMTGGDAIVDSLLRHGIDTIFGLPGVQMYGLFDAFARNANRLKVINARHEQTTAQKVRPRPAATVLEETGKLRGNTTAEHGLGDNAECFAWRTPAVAKREGARRTRYLTKAGIASEKLIASYP